MQEERFAEAFYNQTTVHPVGLVALIILGVWLLCARRRRAIVPLLVIICCIPAGQRLVVLTLDFNFMRILLLLGFARVFARREWGGLRVLPIDCLFAAWCCARIVCHSLQVGTSGALINQLGNMSESAGTYALCRCLLREWEDIRSAIRALVILSVPVAIVFAVEWATARNYFSIFGGVPEITAIREGRLRCQGAFSHPILAGCFWAAVVPCAMVSWWSRPKETVLTVVGGAAIIFIVVATASSTPILALAVAAATSVCLYFRHWLSVVLAVVCMMCAAIHLTMSQPIWFLIARLGAVGGSTGYYRSALIDAAVNHMDEWWLLGTSNTEHWGYYMTDMTNQYILEGVVGGLPTLLPFIGLIVMACAIVLVSLRAIAEDHDKVIISWCVGSMVVVHSAAFLAVSYFGAMRSAFDITLAMAGAIAALGVSAPNANEVGQHRLRWRTTRTTDITPSKP